MYDSAQRTTQRVKPGHHLLLVYLLKMASLTFVTRLRHCCANKLRASHHLKRGGSFTFGDHLRVLLYKYGVSTSLLKKRSEVVVVLLLKLLLLLLFLLSSD